MSSPRAAAPNLDAPAVRGKEICYTEDAAEKAINRQVPAHFDTRIFDSRAFTLLYQKKYLNILEAAVVGSPWLSYEVDPDMRNANFSEFKRWQDF
jgi:hypothetical protein